MFSSQVELLRHILDECNYLTIEYQASTYDYFIQDERLSKAICRSLEVIGEVISRVCSSLKIRYAFVHRREMGDNRYMGEFSTIKKRGILG